MRYLVDFKHDASQQDIDSYLNTNNCVVIQEWDNFDKVYLVETSTALPAADIIERLVEEVGLKVKPLVVENMYELNPHFACHSDPNQPKISISTTDTKDWWKNYSYATPKFDEPSYEISRLGRNISIYLMDSGIQKNHPEFSEANIVDLYSIVPDNYDDHNGHGTGLASIMVGKTCGVSNATIKNVKIFEAGQDTLQSQFLSALDAIINDHVDGTWAICNCSWVIEKNEYIEHKLRLLNDEGVFIVAAAGNQGTSIEDVTPASMMEALTVGAYNKDLKPCDFSNYTGGSAISVTEGATNHGELDGWAPGEEIWAAVLNAGNDGYNYVAGTSASAAIVSAILASNLSAWADENGKPDDWYGYHVDISANSANKDQMTYAFVKANMLDLSEDAKYAESKNLIVAFRDKCTQMNTQLPDEFNFSIKTDVEGPQSLGGIFNPNLTKSIEWINPLPSNFGVMRDGRISGIPTPDQYPEPNELSRKIVGTFNRTNLDDTVELCTINIFVVPKTLKPEDVPDTDPELKVSLQFLCQSTTGVCYFVSGFSACQYNCGGGNVCCGLTCGKGFYDCFCLPGQCN